MAERSHFNPGKAVAGLMQNQPPEQVFKRVLDGAGMPQMDLYDLAIYHLESPATRDVRKPIIATLLTAASIDTAIALKQQGLFLKEMPFTLDDVSDAVDIEIHLVPALKQARELVNVVGKAFQLGQVPRPHFDVVYNRLAPFIDTNPVQAIYVIGHKLAVEGNLFEEGRDYPALLRQVYMDATENVPTYGKILDLIVPSATVFNHPASRDLTYTEVVTKNTFMLGQNGRSTGKYFPGNFYLETAGKEERVALRPEVRVKIEEAWKDSKPWLRQGFPFPPFQITGCPALYGGLIKAALEVYATGVREAAKQSIAA